MNILLPQKFKCYDKDGVLEAEVKDNKLYLYRFTAFKKVMYELTYKIYGNKCIYCGENVANSIDHRIPQDFGGPTITNNLYPTCKSCNSLKTNMMEEEFYEFLSLKSKEEKKLFFKNLKVKQEERRYGTIPSIPEEWIAKPNERRHVIITPVYINEPLGTKYKRLRAFYKKYKNQKGCVILSKDGFLFDGFNILFLGKEENRSDYIQIILENVILKSK